MCVLRPTIRLFAVYSRSDMSQDVLIMTYIKPLHRDYFEVILHPSSIWLQQTRLSNPGPPSRESAINTKIDIIRFYKLRLKYGHKTVLQFYVCSKYGCLVRIFILLRLEKLCCFYLGATRPLTGRQIRKNFF